MSITTKKTHCLFGLFISLLLPAIAPAQQPTSGVLTFHGFIPGRDDGPASLRLRVYDASSEGALLFEEAQTVDVFAESFRALIGNATDGGVPLAVFRDNPSAWIAFALDEAPDEEIGNRAPISSWGYTHHSKFAARADFSSLATNATTATNANTANSASDSLRLAGLTANSYPQSIESLRIVRGVFSQDGGIIVGTGFTVSHPASGQYTVTFTPPFVLPPAVTATADNGGITNQYTVVSTAGVLSNQAIFRTFRGTVPSGPVISNEAVHFIAIGRR